MAGLADLCTDMGENLCKTSANCRRNKASEPLAQSLITFITRSASMMYHTLMVSLSVA
jgi:hypothetical protein